MPLTPGTRLGHYEILAPLGAGGMGEVYRARDYRLNRDVAIKVLPRLLSSDNESLIRFEREAKAAAALNHPNILAIYQMGSYAGFPYLVSELLEGITLSESLRRGPLPLRKAIDYGIQIAHGLAAAHEKGFVHRDLKPDNLFVTKDGRIKILDFGLAKLVEAKQSVGNVAATVTVPGVVMGTLGYMSPEQVRGLACDQRSDIFALGAILYEMLMGRRSFERQTSADTISAILNEEPPSMLQLALDTPLALEKIIRRCLEKSAEQRFQSASDLGFALEALADSTPSSAIAAHDVEKGRARRFSYGWLIALLIALAAGALAYLLLAPSPAPKFANYVQLTHDGQPKSLIGTDGTRLYLGLGSEGSDTFAPHTVAEMSTTGGEPRKISLTTSSDMIPISLSPDGSQLLVIDGQGAPPKGPLWSFSILGGSPRRLGDIIGETASWSPEGNRIAYSNLGDLFVAKADGTESRKLLSVSGDIKNIAWSPDGRSLRFDSSESAGSLGQQLAWEVSADGIGLHRLLADWHNPPDECCGKWTADGKYFLFQSKGQIWTLPQESDFLRSAPKPVQLSASPMTLTSPLSSKDGKKYF